MPLAPGTRLGPYEIVAPIGAGGMGEVWKARDPRLDRTVAIKTSSAQFTERFEREARTIAALNHPHICQIYDVGPDYLVMEYIDGAPLSGPLPLAKALEYGRQICDALDAAHRKGIVHRDLKPANVLVTKSGVKLLDFGLAKTAGLAKADADETVTKVLTGAAQIVGTLQYMSPEQLQPDVKEVDSRADIFSFGLVLYEMLTGKKAYDGPSAASLIAAILERPAPSVSGAAPAALDRSLQRCLAKDPDERWQSARDLGAELEWIASGPAEMAVAVRGAKRGPWLLAAAAVVPALASFGAAWYLRQSSPPAPRLEVPIEIPPGESFFYPVFSPDGTRIALSRSDRELVVRPIDSAESQVLATGAHIYPLAWSPDGRFILYFDAQSSELRRVAVSGGAPQTVLGDVGNTRGAAWDKDGTILFPAGAEMFRLSENGGQIRQRIKGGGFYPTVLPDGRHYLFLTTRTDRGGPEGEAIYLGSLDSSERQKLTNANSQAELSPSGHLVFVRGTTLMAQPFDTSRLRMAGEAVPIATDVRYSTVTRFAQFSVAANGLIVYLTGGLGRSELTWFDRSGKTLGVLDGANLYQDPTMSADGKFVAATRCDPKTLLCSVWVTDLTRGISSRFTPEAEDTYFPSFSPDGTRIAYINAKDEVFIRDMAASGDRQKVTEGRMPAWSPDGTALTLALRRGGISLVATYGDHRVSVYRTGGAGQPAFSPDGHWMAYAADDSGVSEVFVESVPTGRGKWQVSIHGGADPVWRHDGRELFYMDLSRGKIFAVPVHVGASFEAGTPKELFAAHTTGIPYIRRHYAVTPDGQRFLVNVAPEQRQQLILLQHWLPTAR